MIQTEAINLEQTILRNILTNEKFTRKALPFVKPEYFQGVYMQLFKEVARFVNKYNKLPQIEEFKIELDQNDRLGENNYAQAMEILPHVFKVEDVNHQWILDTTEKWCQDRAIYNAIMQSFTIIDGKHETLSKNSLPDILTDALAVSFDTNVGHDYIENVEERFDFYHSQEDRIPFDLDYFNRITGGGLPNKTLNIALAGTGVGKSLFMCHVAAGALCQGRNVLYITMEMAEERIAERIDANLLDMTISDLDTLSKTMLKDRVTNIKRAGNGKLIIKEYPTGQANTSHFRALLNELKLKKKFVPEIIFVDYLNICGSARMKAMGGSINSYTYIKAIAEEMRGLAVEFNLPIVSATQTTRTGHNSSDPGLEDTSESFGLPATADLMFALVTTEELEDQGQIMVKQLKNRYNDPSKDKRFLIGVDKSKMRLYDVELGTDGIIDDRPVFDKSQTQQKFNEFKVG